VRLASSPNAEIDLRIGAAFTRLQTLRLQSKVGRGARRIAQTSSPRLPPSLYLIWNSQFPQLSGEPISYGPCQFPTLGFVVDRYLKREKFQKEPFWRIDVKHKRGELVCKSSSYRVPLTHSSRLA
jgi:DNA topoisomerase-3